METNQTDGEIGVAVKSGGNRGVLLLVVAALAIGAVSYFMFSKTPQPSGEAVTGTTAGDTEGLPVTQTPTVPSDTSAVSAPVGSAGLLSGDIAYTLTDVAKHGTAESCWLASAGGVYDVTTFISKHPGGEKILEGCGKDMTEFFATAHAKQSRDQLPAFKIGILR